MVRGPILKKGGPYPSARHRTIVAGDTPQASAAAAEFMKVSPMIRFGFGFR